MQFFNRLLEPLTNEAEIASLIIHLIGAKISRTTVYSEIQQHPDSPSLLSISDFFTMHGIENIALKIDTRQLVETSTPFVIQFNSKNGSSLFSVVKEIKNNVVTFFDVENHIWRKSHKNKFLDKITDIILLVGRGDTVYEKGYDIKVKAEERKRAFHFVHVFCIPALLILLGLVYFMKNGISMLVPFIYLITSLVGAGISILLIWYEVDHHNQALNKLCTRGTNINCGAILQSEASRILGLNWSTIGLTYFIGLLLLLIFGGLDNKVTLFVLSWISMLTLPYIIFSIHYQWKVARQWCILCLSAMVVLALQILISGLAGWHTFFTYNIISSTQVLQSLVAFIIPLPIVNIILLQFQNSKEFTNNFIQLQKLKNDPEVLLSLLNKQREVGNISNKLGITIGNPHAKYKIIKVCNPYCGPCAEAHEQLEVLLENNENLQVQILFTASTATNDIRTPPVRHFLAMADIYPEKQLRNALDDWYLNDIKNYDAFADKYPLGAELEQQNEKIDMMNNCCNKLGIKYTPTFFISINYASDTGSNKYYQLPRLYNVQDLKYLLINDYVFQKLHS